MKYLNPVKGIVVWTFNCLEIWFGGLPEVATLKVKYWNCNQTFFSNKTDREIYRQAEENLIVELKNRRDK